VSRNPRESGWHEHKKDHPQTSADAREKGATPNGHGAKSDALRDAAIRALLTEKSIQRAAKQCRVNERTLRRWLTEDAAFMAEYDHARQAQKLIVGSSRSSKTGGE
jgi:hypothetical protein